MAKVQNTFLKSKMNKDLDARILPEGEYRDARNAQISKSESSQVGNLENTLGNHSIQNYQTLTQTTNIKCIGHFSDEVNSTVYLFFTDYVDPFPNRFTYNPQAKNFIISTNVLTNQSNILVQGAFLNFSQTNIITGVNVLEDLLFFTDDRNQPRVINTLLANPDPTTNKFPTYYLTEDQISVAKYNPYSCMEMFQKSILDPGEYETTMKDVSSKFLPNGGQATTTSNQTGASINVTLNIIGQVNTSASPWGSANVSLFDSFDNTMIPTGATVTSITLNTTTTPNSYDIALSTSITTTTTRNTLVFEPNPYFNGAFGGDPDYLESIFPRFSYRFKFTDNTYSIFAPFTQIAFIPKQDGYFMFAESPNQEKDDQNEAYRSTIVYFVENKVNNIGLRIPLPFNNYTLSNALKIEEIDILYKESDGIAVRVVETIPIGRIQSQSGVCLTNGAQTPGASGNNIAIDGLQGGITIGDPITGPGIDSGTTILSFTPTDPSNAVSGNITVSSTVPILDDNVLLTIGSPNFFVYDYTSTKPTKTLPESNLVRVFDKIPVRAKAQEVTGNRVIYGNFLNKIDPPAFLNYNVASTIKPEFTINEVTAAYAGAAATYTAFIDTIAINVSKSTLPWYVGYVITSNTYGVIIPPGTQIASTDSNTTGAANITLTETVTFPAGTPINVVLIMEPGADTENSESIIEYPNHSVKTNRNYQIGFVLSDRYGRQSSVILSNNETKIKVAGVEYSGSTLFSPYIDESVNQTSWPGNSLKVLMNEPINENLYNGDVTSADYNPLGWYSYKIVVKQTEQEYYNVYLPGIMASYPENRTLEIGQTSHVVLINDNINKIPRDLTEVGPDQKQFRSSVQLFGRVQNITTATTPISGNTNKQYYPGTNSDTVSIISTVNDLFDYDPINPNQPNYFPQFYSLDSNPLVARISTEAQIGQIATTGQTYNYIPAAGTIVNPPNQPTGTSGAPVTPLTPTNKILITNVASQVAITTNSLTNYLLTGQGVPEGTYIGSNDAPASDGSVNNITLVNSANNPVYVNLTDGIEVTFTPASATTDLLTPGIQYLAVYETEAVESAIDIFWESSSTGLIGDLNAAILNNQDQPAGSNITWNPSEFTEGLAAGGNILNGNGFNIVDNFGQTITIDPSTDTVEFGAPNNLPAITDGNGNDCNGSPSTGTTQVRDYFRLVPGSPTGPWQVRTTSQNSPDNLAEGVNYFDNIFYMYDQNEALRQFNFNFKITVGGQVNYITNLQANLQNVAPEYYKITANNTVNSSPVTYGPGGSNPLPEFVPVRTRKNTEEIAIINFSNGSANKDNTLSDGALSVKDLQMIDSFGEIDSVYDQRIGSPNGQLAEVLFMGNPEPIFAIQEQSSDEAGTLQVKLINQFANSDQASVPAALYYVTLLIQDGQTTVEQKLEIDMRLELNNSNFLNKFQRSKDLGAADPQSQTLIIPLDTFTKYGQCRTNDFYITGDGYRDWKSYGMTLINIPSTTPGVGNDEIGYYIYAAGFFQNHDPAIAAGCTQEYAPSIDLVTYSQGANEVFNNTITIPFNTPNLSGHKVQKQKSFVTSENWQLPPYCHGKGKVVGTNVVIDGITYDYEIEPVGSETAQSDISACMLFFKNDWNDGTADAGEKVRQSRIANTINNADASNRIDSAVNLNNGNVAIRFSPTGNGSITYDNISLQIDDYMYTYGGGFNELVSPWFFSPGINSDSVMKVWAMWIYSEWFPPYWEQNDRSFARWSPAWNPYTGNDQTPQPVPDFPLVISANYQNNWMGSTNGSSTAENCPTAPIYVNQNYEVTQANNYLYSIQ